MEEERWRRRRRRRDGQREGERRRLILQSEKIFKKKICEKRVVCTITHTHNKHKNIGQTIFRLPTMNLTTRKIGRVRTTKNRHRTSLCFPISFQINPENPYILLLLCEMQNIGQTTPSVYPQCTSLDGRASDTQQGQKQTEKKTISNLSQLTIPPHIR